ncbi:hypothetical protein B0H13DRAFT_2262890 [Mycena leptocephala]|nr:hypothetical protein B0H13DRAFT_2262890 [Mycena leptocephala]
MYGYPPGSLQPQIWSLSVAIPLKIRTKMSKFGSHAACSPPVYRAPSQCSNSETRGGRHQTWSFFREIDDTTVELAIQRLAIGGYGVSFRRIAESMIYIHWSINNRFDGISSAAGPHIAGVTPTIPTHPA